MPELPDVEGFRTVLAEHGAGRQVERVEVADAGVLRDVSAQHLQRSLRGRRFSDPERHGKWLIARTDGPALLMHFGMTGQLHWAESGTERHRHDRVVFTLPDGELRFRDMRKLQGLTLAPRPADIDRILGDIGPDALQVGKQDFAAALGTGRQAVKAALMDQSIIAGLGNLLTDEILWHACINPRRPVRQLEPSDRDRLHGQMRQVLREAIPNRQVPAQAGWLTGARDADHADCPRCGTPLEKDRVGGRSTVWCPCCQSVDPGPCCEPGHGHA